MVFLLCLQFVCKQSANSSQSVRTERNKNGKIPVFPMHQQSIYDNNCILYCYFFVKTECVRQWCGWRGYILRRMTAVFNGQHPKCLINKDNFNILAFGWLESIRLIAAGYPKIYIRFWT